MPTRKRELANISFHTVDISMRHYFLEVPISGRNRSPQPSNSMLIEDYPQYLNSICRNGNAVSLLRGFSEIMPDNFFLPKNLEYNSKYLFWTFDQWFVADLKKKIGALSEEQVEISIRLITKNFIPYDDNETLLTSDCELAFCYRKKMVMMQKREYAVLFKLDHQNRSTLLQEISMRKNYFSSQKQRIEDKIYDLGETTATKSTYSFKDLLKPIKGTVEETLSYMEEFFSLLIDEPITGSVRIRNIFSKIQPDRNDANPKGVNGTIMAFIEFFDIHGYFEKTHNGSQIIYKDLLVTFLTHTQNKIGNLDSIIGKRHDDIYYKAMLSKFKIRGRSVKL